MKEVRRQSGWRRSLARGASVLALQGLLALAAAGAAGAEGLLADGLSGATLGGEVNTAALPSNPSDLGTQLAQPLDAVNADRYRQIFSRQEKGDLAGADRLIADLTDSSLLGHVLATRYLAPRYKAKAKELSDWLKLYAALPEAESIYRLAQRKGAAQSALKKPINDWSRMGSPDEGSNDRDPDWLAGLAAWQKKNFAAAADAFGQAALKAKLSSWDQAAAAYWAARAHIRAKEPGEVSQWLKIAAEHPRTFYGLLAIRALGLEPKFDWRVPELTEDHSAKLLDSRAGKRALSLLQIGQTDLAEKELLILQEAAGPGITDALIAISQAYRLPSLALKIGAWRQLKDADHMDAAMYPVPSWMPKGGFNVDPALLYAIMRQESGFNPLAKSPAGALGLMQFMPKTAALISGGTKPNLKDPVVSIGLGQKYLARLLAEPVVAGDLFLMAAAYNAGPGNLAKWKKRSNVGDDPLLFIETIPVRETRLFVERVMAAYWVYQVRLGQPQTSLEAVANGAWPTYTGFERKLAALQ